MEQQERSLGWDQTEEGVSVGRPPAPAPLLLLSQHEGGEPANPDSWVSDISLARHPRHTLVTEGFAAHLPDVDLQHRHHGSLLEMQSPGPHPDPLSLTLHFSKTFGLSVHALQCEELRDRRDHFPILLKQQEESAPVDAL